MTSELIHHASYCIILPPPPAGHKLFARSSWRETFVKLNSPACLGGKRTYVKLNSPSRLGGNLLPLSTKYLSLDTTSTTILRRWSPPYQFFYAASDRRHPPNALRRCCKERSTVTMRMAHTRSRSSTMMGDQQNKNQPIRP